MNTRKIAISAGLAAISAVLQLIHFGYQSPQWGMWIDLVAVTWFVAYFLQGIKSSLLVASIIGIIITFFTSDTWIGAGMKLLATLPLIVNLYFWNSLYNAPVSIYKKWIYLIPPLLSGLVMRMIIILPVNYFLAIPFWTKMTTSQAFSAFPWYIIAGFNLIQGILDVTLAWIIVYRFKLGRFSNLE